MSNVLPFPIQAHVAECDLPDVNIIPVTLQFREYRFGAYSDFEPVNPKAIQVAKFGRRRYVNENDLAMLEEIGFVVEVV